MSSRRWSAPADLRKLSAVLKCYEIHRLCMISARQNANTSGVRAAGGSAVRCYPIGQHVVMCVLVHANQSESRIYLRMQSGAACTLLDGASHIQFVCVAMWSGPLPSFSIEPSDEIFFEIPQPTGGVTATVTLRNTGTSKLHYKLESTVPALYYFKPRYDSVCARQARSSEIFLLPFDFYHPENHKHELVVHIMLAQREEEENLRQLWEHNDQREILTRRVKCIPWVRGELAMEPNHELVFEGSFDVPFSSNLCLTNPSEDWMHFDIETSSTNLSVFPPDGTISGHNRKELIVIRKPLKSGDNTATNETIAIQSAVLPKSFWEPYKEKWSTVPKKNRTIKCVYNVLNTPSSLSDSKPVGVALLDPD